MLTFYEYYRTKIITTKSKLTEIVITRKFFFLEFSPFSTKNKENKKNYITKFATRNHS